VFLSLWGGMGIFSSHWMNAIALEELRDDSLDGQVLKPVRSDEQTAMTEHTGRYLNFHDTHMSSQILQIETLILYVLVISNQSLIIITTPQSIFPPNFSSQFSLSLSKSHQHIQSSMKFPPKLAF
jgi:hypothetical protein